MKPKTKTKNLTKTKTSKRSKKISSVVLVHAKKSGWRHFRLVNQLHTGKLIHFRHTSHLALIGILVIVGFFLMISDNVTNAITDNQSIVVSAIVPGPAPTIGATITQPVSGLILLDKNTVEVSGTCEVGTFVVINDNSLAVGSTICSQAGIFNLTVQLLIGDNTLSALDYDNMNQAGPTTPPVMVIYNVTSENNTNTTEPKP